MSQVRIEAFFSVPPCSGGIMLSRVLDEIKAEFGDKVEVISHRGPTPRIEELKISTLPALVIGDLVRIMGLCPSKESVAGALRECGIV